MNTYKNRKNANKNRKEDDQKQALNGYKSPSPLNELCEYVETWEKKSLLWSNSSIDTRYLILDNSLTLNNSQIRHELKTLIREHKTLSDNLRANLGADSDDLFSQLDVLLQQTKEKMAKIVPDERLLANYVIDIVYANKYMSPSFAWIAYGDTILENLRNNTPVTKRTTIIEVPYESHTSYEFLSKHYEMIEISDKGAC